MITTLFGGAPEAELKKVSSIVARQTAKAGHAVGREVVDEVLDPGKVGVAPRGKAELPARVLGFAEPFGVIEARKIAEI
jgi:hypothetical protein